MGRPRKPGTARVRRRRGEAVREIADQLRRWMDLHEQQVAALKVIAAKALRAKL